VRPSAVGLTPFALYVLLFLAIPTVLAVLSGLFDARGNFTIANVAALFTPDILKIFASSFWVSAVTAIVGAVVGALVCYALLGVNPQGTLRSMVTVILRDFGINIFANGVWLYQVPGLLLPYLYFQVPLMIITFMPALEGLKPQWAEANATLGGTRLTYWVRIAGPVLAPSFLGSLLLLFANAFSSYATAATLISQGAQIVPLRIRAALISETVLGRSNTAGALALGMIVVMVVLMWGYSALQSRTTRWQQ
jgi:putative spermidine/putrescine transport system permease protein